MLNISWVENEGHDSSLLENECLCPAIQADSQALLNNFAIIYEREIINKLPALDHKKDLINKQPYFRSNLEKIKGLALLLISQCVIGLPLYALGSADSDSFNRIFTLSLAAGTLGGVFISAAAFLIMAREYIGSITEKFSSETIPFKKKIELKFSPIKKNNTTIEIKVDESMENVKVILGSKMKITDITAYDLKSNISIHNGLTLNGTSNIKSRGELASYQLDSLPVVSIQF